MVKFLYNFNILLTSRTFKYQLLTAETLRGVFSFPFSFIELNNGDIEVRSQRHTSKNRNDARGNLTGVNPLK